MIYVLIAIILVLLLLMILMWARINLLRHENQRLRAVVDNQHDFSFLVNRQFEVEETNVPQQTNNSDEPNILGNVLHCKNAKDAGRCGTHQACKECPVRFVISKSFERKDGFSDLEACMELYGEDNKVLDVDVQVDGSYVEVNKEDHMVVNVKDVTSNQGDARPKILFITKDMALFDDIRQLLANDFRVMHADKQRQALHRLLMATDYQFHAVFTDQAFYEAHESVTKLLVKNDMIKVFVFTSEQDVPADGHIHYVSPDIEREQLMRQLLD